MIKHFSFVVVLVLAIPAGAAHGRGALSTNCYAGYPHGFQGSFPTVSDVIANPGAQGYHMEEDYQIWSERTSQQLRNMLSQKAAGGPLQFTFVQQTKTMSQQTLFVVVEILARGSDSQGNAQAYWGDVMVQRAGLKGYLFTFTTHAYEPQGDWTGQILQEAVDDVYPRLANGWTCGN